MSYTETEEFGDIKEEEEIKEGNEEEDDGRESEMEDGEEDDDEERNGGEEDEEEEEEDIDEGIGGVLDEDEDENEKSKITTMDNINLGPSMVKNGSIIADINSSDSDSDSDSDSEDEEEYISKVDHEKKMEYIKETHTQEISKTYEEMVSLTKITRNRNKTDGEDLIVDKNHTTIPILTKYEKARILGIRISQLNEGAPRYINVAGNTIIDNNIIAEKELRMKKLPFIITRPLPNGEKEHWRLRDLEIL